MTKHTPLPWTAQPSDDEYFLDCNIVRADGLAVAVALVNGDITKAEADKTGRLIAAAPDTYAMCERFAVLNKNASRSGNRVFIDARDWEAFQAYNREALAKAEGGAA